MHKKSRRANKRQRRQKHQKCRTRKGGRRLRMRMKGGLNQFNLQQIDCPEINLRQGYSFGHPNEHLNMFKRYVFGSHAQGSAWESLLTECKANNVPVFILSAGDKIGIIRMLQLLGLADMFEEVLCTNDNELVNPLTKDGKHDFQGQSKYDVIRAILRERFDIYKDVDDPLVAAAAGPPIGYLMDDNVHNDDTIVTNKTVPFKNVNSEIKPVSDTQKINKFYQFAATYPSLLKCMEACACAEIDVINEVASWVNKDLVKILFIDFDNTLQQYGVALPFHDDTFTMDFHNSFPIRATTMW